MSIDDSYTRQFDSRYITIQDDLTADDMTIQEGSRRYHNYTRRLDADLITIQDDLTADIMTIQEGSRRHDDYTRRLDASMHKRICAVLTLIPCSLENKE